MARVSLSGKMAVSTKEAGFEVSNQARLSTATIMASAGRVFGMKESV